jgi:hypothetical protein
MPDITINIVELSVYMEKVNIEKLTEELKEKFPDKIIGISYYGENKPITVFFIEGLNEYDLMVVCDAHEKNILEE